MEYLVFAVILYFVLQTAGNLVFILRGGGADPSSDGAPAAPDHDWQGPSPREQMEGLTDHPTFWGEDVEEATWRDL
jgi:hypothetical protein